MYRFGEMDPDEFLANPSATMCKQAQRLRSSIGRNVLGAAGATFGAISNPEVFDLSTDVSRASFGALAVYTGLKAVVNAQSQSALAQVAVPNLLQQVETLKAPQDSR